MQHHRDSTGSPVWAEWHKQREKARRESMDVSEYTAGEIEAYDLDTARIDGSDNPDTFRTEPFDAERNTRDIRDDPEK